MVGIERTLKRVAVLMFESTSSFATFAFPAYSDASCSRIGAIMRHGAHHVAQKSTTANPSYFSIDCSKSASVTATAFDMCFLLVGGIGPAGCEIKLCATTPTWIWSPSHDDRTAPWHPHRSHRNRGACTRRD